MNKHEKIFHQSAGMASPHYKAPTPFEIIGGMVKDTVKNAGKVMTKVASAIMAPTVNEMKIRDAKMKKMSEQAKSGEFNR